MFDPYHKWLGIPAKDQPPNHYRLLGIELFETDADVIDAAANKQMAYVQGCATGPHLALSQKLLNEIVHEIAASWDSYFLLGSQDSDIQGPHIYNCAYMFGPGWDSYQYYRKTRLVILGEYLPFGNSFPRLRQWR